MNIFSIRTTALSFIFAGTLLLAACDNAAKTNEVVIPDSPDAAVQTVISEFANGNSGIVWEALPASYQSDINELAHLLGSSADEEIYNKSFSLFARLAEVIDQQKSFIVNSSFMDGKSAEELSKLETALPSVVALMNTLTSSALSSTEGLIHFKGEAFFDTTVSQCVEHLEAIGQLTGDETKLADYASTIVTVVDSDEQQATLSIAIPGQEAEEIVFAKVEERWVPLEMKNKWATKVKDLTASIKAIPTEDFEAQKTTIMGAFTMLNGVLTNVASAKTQEQFDQSLREATMPLMGIIMMLSQAGKKAQ